MKVNDRGTMKWTSIMLPEHIDALNKMWEEQEYKEMPVLDEQQIMENNLLLQEALENDLKIRIKHFADHDFKFIEGYLLHIDILNKTVYMEEAEVKLGKIIEVEIL